MATVSIRRDRSGKAFDVTVTLGDGTVLGPLTWYGKGKETVSALKARFVALRDGKQAKDTELQGAKTDLDAPFAGL